MFDRFRVRYPQGCLISKLLRIENGNYVVQALVQVEGATLATGLAADDNIEIAEDRARSRALAVLGLLASGVPDDRETPSVSPSITLQPSTPISPATASQNYQHEVLPEIPQVEVAPPTFSQPKFSEVDAIPFADDLTSQEAEMPAPQNNLSLELPTFTSPKSELEPAAKGSSPKKTAILEEKLSPKQIIARTDIEIKRLGWSRQQGSDYLQATYGKKVRSELTDRELQEFLDYLELQPSPNELNDG
ncbi:MAG: hypothetical protein KME17_05925 [Cyanosarcina radialis HA8281-LM2]|jgi:hypothetical protein|nr:hypothetical protein [Cyanosarcina radialis HA8281-LM2]